MEGLSKRYCYYDSFGRYICNHSRWYGWGRWLLLGIVIFAFVGFLSLLWYASHRRRRQGARPFYGTGWMTSNNNPSQGYPQSGYNRPPPPPPGQQGYDYGQGLQQDGRVYGEPQEPAPAHTGGKENYAPPPGPPPSRY